MGEIKKKKKKTFFLKKVKYIERAVQAYLFLHLISKFLSKQQMKENPHKTQTKSK